MSLVEHIKNLSSKYSIEIEMSNAELELSNEILKKLAGILKPEQIQLLFDKREYLPLHNKYTLIFNERFLLESWEKVVEVTPYGISTQHGYVNTESIDHKDWYYKMKGTATICVPTSNKIINEVLSLIK